MGTNSHGLQYQETKKPWVRTAHPWLPVAMWIGSGAWMSRFKKEEKEATYLHYMSVPLKFHYINFTILVWNVKENFFSVRTWTVCSIVSILFLSRFLFVVTLIASASTPRFRARCPTRNEECGISLREASQPWRKQACCNIMAGSVFHHCIPTCCSADSHTAFEVLGCEGCEHQLTGLRNKLILCVK